MRDSLPVSAQGKKPPNPAVDRAIRHNLLQRLDTHWLPVPASELGFEFERSRLRFGGKVHDTRIDNVITAPLGRPNCYENIGQLKSLGFVLHTCYRWDRLSMAANFHRNLLTLNDEIPNGYAHNGLGISQGNTLTASLDYAMNDRVGMGRQGRFVRGIKQQSTSIGKVGTLVLGIIALQRTIDCFAGAWLTF